jgi:ParB/RepB/Spo0J family partition protein
MIEFREIDLQLEQLDPPADAHRLAIDPERVAALADDIAAHGLLQRIGVRGPSPEGRYEVIWGDRRSQAFRLLGRATIPARACAWDTDPLHARSMENLGGEPLTPLEEAHVCRRHYERLGSVNAVARVLRRSTHWVQARLELLEQPEDVQAAVQEHRLPLAVANALAAIDHDGYRQALIREAVNTGATAATVQVWVAHYHQDRERIVHNHVTVEQLARERQAFVLMANCEGCGGQVDARQIRAMHFCPDCHASLRAVIADGSVPAAP